MSGASGRWVTDAGDERIGAFVCCGPCARARLTVPFYEASTYTSVYCPACALAHFGVRPPETVAATECGHATDDIDCKCWGLWLVEDRMTGLPPQWCRGFTEAVRGKPLRSNLANIEIEKREATRQHRTSSYEVRMLAPMPKQEPADRSFQLQCDPPSAVKCHNIWCKEFAPTGHYYCSPRCKDYTDQRNRIYHRLESYRTTMLDKWQHLAGKRARTVAIESEVAWAEQQTKSEVDALERQWRALTWRT